MGIPVLAKKSAARKKTHLLVDIERGTKPVASVLSKNGSVRWGPAMGIELPCDVEGVMKYEYLFKPDSNGVRLMYHKGMTGEITAGNSTLPLEEMEQWGLVRGRGANRYIVISRAMGGSFEYKGMTAFFSFEAPPTPPEKIKIPKIKLTAVPFKYRRPLLAREDRPFVAIAWFCYALLALISFMLATADIPATAKPEEVAERFAKLIYQAPQAKTRVKQEMDKQKEEEEKAAEEAAAEAEVEEEVEEVVEEEKPEPEKEPEVEKEPEAEKKPEVKISDEERKAAIRKEVSKKGLLGVLGGRGRASRARRAGSIIDGRGKVADLDKVLDKVKGLRVGSAEGDDFKATALDTSGALSEDAAAAGAASERMAELAGRSDAEVESIDTDELEALNLKEAVAVLHRTVETYLGGLRYLYNRELRKNPDLEGKITVSITVDPDGNVTEVKVAKSTMNAPDLEKAIISRIKRWTFPPVAPKPVTVTYPFVFFPSM